MVGRPLDNLYPEHVSTIGEEILRVEDWTVMHPTTPGRKVADSASFDVRAGEIVGIAGLMGAGRTELAMSVFGQSYGRKVSGKLFMHGKEINLPTVDDAINAGLAYATEDRKRYGLNLIDDIRRNISAASLKKISSGPSVVNSHEEIKHAEIYRKQMNIRTPNVMKVVGQLSGGNQQKVVLSKWMMTEPEVLILDEPTRGIDVGAKYEIYTIIQSLADAGKAVVVISSELPELLGICDRIFTLAFGRITGQMPAAEATQEKLMKLMTQEREVA
ncbi:MAG TPA: ATP-binding cassette domain-containing protein, partial [Tessaracoccus flavescens]|nr:ATP-binding cassette domain-containing protein [Tessaracoccus flavescens]